MNFFSSRTILLLDLFIYFDWKHTGNDIKIHFFFISTSVLDSSCINFKWNYRYTLIKITFYALFVWPVNCQLVEYFKLATFFPSKKLATMVTNHSKIIKVSHDYHNLGYNCHDNSNEKVKINLLCYTNH